MAIADDSKGDVKLDEKGRTLVDWENVNRSKLRVETRIRTAALLDPVKWGTRVTIDGMLGVQHAEETLELRLTKMRTLVNEYATRGGNVAELLEMIGLPAVTLLKQAEDQKEQLRQNRNLSAESSARSAVA